MKPIKTIKDLINFLLFFSHEKKAKIPLKRRIKKFPLSPVDKTKVKDVSHTKKLKKENLLYLKVIRAKKVQ